MTLLNDVKEQPKQAVSQLPAQEQDSGGQVLEFTGLDLREEAGSGAFLECENVSTRNYPCLSPRLRRSVGSESLYQNVDDIFRFDGKTVFRRGTQLWYDPDGNSSRSVGTVLNSKKQFAVLNTRLVVFPDAVCLDMATAKLSPLGVDVAVTGAELSDNKTISGNFADANIIRASGLSSYSDVELVIPYYEEEPTGTASEQNFYTLNGAVYKDESVLLNKYIVPSYDADTGYAVRYGHLMNHRVSGIAGKNTNGVYGKITAISKAQEDGYMFYNITAEIYLTGTTECVTFKNGDVVFVSGLLDSANNEVDEFATRVWAAAPTSVTVDTNALYGYHLPASQTVTIKRKVPQLAFVCASSNRLWGVSNAVENTILDDDGKPVTFNGRAVFCSKLGDPSNWYYYQGVSMDSWTAPVASEGDFTGICEWSDDVLCFKEREMFRITGSIPSAYTLYSFSIPGVEQGSGGSIAIIDEAVFYKNEWGVYRYSGGTPSRVSENVADALTGAGCAGTDGRNYFLSVSGGIYVYDTWHNAWTRHDSDVGGRFAWDGNTLLLLIDTTSAEDAAWRRKVVRVDSANADGVEWNVKLHPDYGTTKTSYYSTALNLGYKYYKFVFLRGELLKHGASASDPYVEVWAKMGDGRSAVNGGFEKIGTQSGAGKFVLRMPVGRFREDRIQLMLKGKGDCVLRDIRYVYSTGSEWIQSDKGVM